MLNSEQLSTLVFDQLPLGVITIDRQSQFTYGNPVALEWFGPDLLTKGFLDLVEPNKRPEVAEQLARRKHGVGGFYQTGMLLRHGQYVPMEVAGIPIFDGEGHHLGSVGIIRNLAFRTADEAVQTAISKSRDEQELFQRVAMGVKPLIPFDTFSVSRYTAERSHSTTLYRFHDRGQDQSPSSVHWWNVPAELRGSLDQPFITGDFDAWLKRPEFEKLRQHPDVKRFLAGDYRSYMRFPIFSGCQLIAAVEFFSRQPQFYSEEHLKLLHRLPIAQAVQMALDHLQVKEQEFRHQLLRSLLSCDRAIDVAQKLVDMLADHYQWTHTSLLSVDRAAKEFRLLAQGSRNRCPLPEGYRQRLDVGQLGKTLKEGKLQNLEDSWNRDPNIPYEVLSEEFRSELCAPLNWDPDPGRIHLLLNVEDQMESAFSKEEAQTLEDILDEVKPVLYRMWILFALESAFRSSSDAFLLTDALGTLRQANPAALRMLKCPADAQPQRQQGFDLPASLRDKPLASLFADQIKAQQLLKGWPINAEPTQLVALDGSIVDTRVQSSELPVEAGGGKFVAITDLAPMRRLHELEAIGKFYYELASQIGTPISLVRTWLNRLYSTLTDRGQQDLAELAGQSLAQLHQIQTTYVRMALHDEEQRRRIPTRRVSLNLADELNLLRQRLPRSDKERLKLHPAAESAQVQADCVQVGFIFKTILSYLLHYSPPEGTISVDLCTNRRLGTISVRIIGTAPPEPSRPDLDDSLERAKFQLVLGEGLIRTFSANNDITYHVPLYEGSQVTFQLDFRLDEALEEEQP